MLIYVFGDSISYGFFDLRKFGWVRRLKFFLKKRIPNLVLKNKSFIGADSSSVLAKARIELRKRRVDIVIFAVGINDSQIQLVKNKPRTPLVLFKDNVSQLIALSNKVARKTIFIGPTKVDEDFASSVWWDKRKSYSNEMIEKYNEALKSVCEQNNVSCVDLFDSFFSSHPNSLVFDGVHPNSLGHQVISEMVEREFIKL